MSFDFADLLRHMGISGLLILVLLVVMIAFAVYKLAVRQMSWKLLWLGGASMVLGMLGTVLGIIASYRRVAIAGGAADPSTLSNGIAWSFVSLAMGLGALLVAGALTSLLYFARRVEAENNTERS